MKRILAPLGIIWFVIATIVIIQMINEIKSREQPGIPANEVTTPLPPENLPNPDKNTTTPPVMFKCPTTSWIDCMPRPDADAEYKYRCSDVYIKWAEDNCPNFEGVAY
jgi:hypothetical protein